MTAERADFGARLRAAREARGLTLKDIAAATKISPLTLEALERNDARRLPGGLFSRAFVRSYSREVGLDPEQTVREFVERFGEGTEDGADEPVRTRVVPTSEIDGLAARSGVRWLGLGVTIVLVIGWISIDRYYSARVEQTAAPSRATSGDLPGPPAAPPLARAAPATPPPIDAAPALSVPKSASPAPPDAKPAPGTTAGTPAGQSAVPPEIATQPPPQAAEATAAAPIVDATLPLQLVLSTQAPCWISVSVDGRRIAGRTLQAGEKLALSAGQAVVLTAGDAGALSYTINGAPGRSLGTVGQRVTVLISTGNYRTFVAGRQ